MTSNKFDLAALFTCAARAIERGEVKLSKDELAKALRGLHSHMDFHGVAFARSAKNAAELVSAMRDAIAALYVAIAKRVEALRPDFNEAEYRARVAILCEALTSEGAVYALLHPHAHS